MKTITKFFVLIISLLLLTACGSKWKVDVDLTPEEELATEEKLAEGIHMIETYEGPEGRIPWEGIIQKAEALAKLGKVGDGIEEYNSWLNDGYKTKAIINNLGRLYEQVGEYDLAIQQYQRLINEYLDEHYLYDITWAYLRAKDRRMAEKAFNAWQLAFQKTDEQTQLEIKKLREEEQNN